MGILTAHAEGTPTCNFKNCARVPIDSLKAHFSPKQAGSGEPAPNNVREITGWNNVKVYSNGKNLAHVIGYSASTITSPTSTRVASNSYGTSIDTTLPNDKLVITQSQWPDSSNKLNYTNGYIAIGLDNLQYDAYYDISFKVTNIINNPLNATLQDLGLATPGGGRSGPYEVKDNILIYKNIRFRQSSTYLNEMDFDLRICGMSFTLSEFMITLSNTNDGVFEPYHGNIIPVTFPPVGKNLLDPNNYYFAGTGVVAFGGNASSSVPDGSIYLKAGTYTFSCDVTCNVIGGSYGTGGTLGMASNATSFIFTLKSDNTVRLFIVKNNATEEDFQSYHYQLEKNSTATTYEPYNTTIYGGYVDVAKGEIVATHACYNTTWGNYDTSSSDNAVLGNNERRVFTSDIAFKDTSQQSLHYCNIAPIIDASSFNTDDIGISGGNSTIIVKLPVNTNNDTILQFCADLATPITYSITPTQLSTFLGQNSVYSNANSLTEVDYALYESAQIRAAKARIMANEPHLATINSSIASFNTDMIAPLKECKVNFLPVQSGSGDPSPTNVRSISGWTGVDVTRCGKNLFNQTYYSDVSNYTDSLGGYKYTAPLFLQPNTTYRITPSNPQALIDKGIYYVLAINKTNDPYDISGGTSTQFYYPVYNGKFIVNGTNGVTNVFTTGPTGTIRFGNTNLSYAATHLAAIMPVNWQLEIGSTATSYELYNGTTLPIDWTDEAGTVYGGYVDLVTGELIQTHKKVVLNDSTKWANTATTENYFVRSYSVSMSDRKTGDKYIITSSIAPSYYTNASYWIQWNKTNAYYPTLWWDTTQVTPTPVEDIQTLSANNAIEICYPLATPITYQLTPQQLKTLRGTNNIWSNANGNIELKYFTH